MNKKIQLISVLTSSILGALAGVQIRNLETASILNGFDVDDRSSAGASFADQRNVKRVRTIQPNKNGRLKKIRKSTLHEQSVQAARFLEQCKENPELLYEFLPQLDLPDSLRHEVIRSAVVGSASIDPLKVMQGIEGIRRKEDRIELTIAACEQWSKSDPAAAHEWALNGSYPEALVGTVVNFWKSNPAAALSSFSQLKSNQLSESVSAIVFSDSEIYQGQGRELHRFVQKLSQTADPRAAATEIELLKNLAATDPEYVEACLDANETVALRDMVATDLAMGKSNGDWEKADKWLREYEGGQLTRANYELWRRWGEADSGNLIKNIEGNSDFPNREKIIDYFRAISKSNKSLSAMEQWINSQDENTSSHDK